MREKSYIRIFNKKFALAKKLMEIGISKSEIIKTTNLSLKQLSTR